MSPNRWVISAFLVWHVVAVVGAAIPSPSVIRDSGARSENQIAAIDDEMRIAAIDRVHEGAWAALAPVRWLTGGYVRAGGLHQQWSMFGNPANGGEYVRIRHYILRAGLSRPSLVATELVYPKHREDRFKLFRGFLDSFRDKAIAASIEQFLSDRTRRLRAMRRDETFDLQFALSIMAHDPPPQLAPVTRFFARRYAASLPAGDSIVRSELWYGTAPRPQGDAETHAEMLRRRGDLLSDYYAGPILDPFGIMPPDGATQREGDILWHLLYYENP
jgi:hypothetical protein